MITANQYFENNEKIIALLKENGIYQTEEEEEKRKKETHETKINEKEQFEDTKVWKKFSKITGKFDELITLKDEINKMSYIVISNINNGQKCVLIPDALSLRKNKIFSFNRQWHYEYNEFNTIIEVISRNLEAMRINISEERISKIKSIVDEYKQIQFDTNAFEFSLAKPYTEIEANNMYSNRFSINIIKEISFASSKIHPKNKFLFKVEEENLLKFVDHCSLRIDAEIEARKQILKNIKEIGQAEIMIANLKPQEE